MAFDLKTFETSLIRIAEEINKNNYTYSNEVLYAACDGVSILPSSKTATSADIDKLSSVMLLIGRAYAASPERRKGAKSVNDGMITFFEAIAKTIVSHSDYDDWRNRVISITKCNYAYDGKQLDCDLLKKSKECVIDLNNMLRKAISDFDEKNGLDDIKNCISFCTKFLHFIVPHIFYIKDSISWESIWSIYVRRSNSVLKYDGKELKIPQFDVGNELNKAYPIFAAKRGNAALYNTQENAYWYHCRGCYAVSCMLKDIALISQTKGFNGIPNIYSLPRLVDSVLLNIQH